MAAKRRAVRDWLAGLVSWARRRAKSSDEPRQLPRGAPVFDPDDPIDSADKDELERAPFATRSTLPLRPCAHARIAPSDRLPQLLSVKTYRSLPRGSGPLPRPLYNVQFSLDLDSPLILAYDVFAQPTDAGTLGPSDRAGHERNQAIERCNASFKRAS